MVEEDKEDYEGGDMADEIPEDDEGKVEQANLSLGEVRYSVKESKKSEKRSNRMVTVTGMGSVKGSQASRVSQIQS